MNTPDPPPERAAFLRDLAAADFCPDDERAANGLRDEIERFAVRFWDIPPFERQTAWSLLSGRCRDWQNSRRLAQLADGCGVAVGPHPDPVCEELAELARDLFRLPPRVRSVRRAEWLRDNAGRWAELSDAARALSAAGAAAVALDRPLFETLRTDGKSLAVPGMAVPVRASVANPPEDVFDRCVRWANFVITAAAIGLLVGGPILCLVLAGRPKPDRWSPTAPAPAFSPPNSPIPGATMTPDRLAACREYERNPVGPKPHDFALYQLLGGKSQLVLIRHADGKTELTTRPR